MPFTIRQAVKFSLLAGLMALLLDASLVHGLLWDHDPSWSAWAAAAWVIVAVFGLGTAWFGIGIRPGLGLSTVLALLLGATQLWQAESPEPSTANPSWLLGVPAHLLALFGGYLLAVWMWRRSHRPGATALPAAQAARAALLSTLAIVGIDVALTHLFLFHQTPDAAFIGQRALITVAYLLIWTAYLGDEATAWVVGAGLLTLTWTACGLYLPHGFPSRPTGPISDSVLWAKAFPGGCVATLIGWRLGRLMLRRPSQLAANTAIALLCLGALATTARAEGLEATASASGTAQMVIGPNPVNLDRTQRVEGSIAIAVTDAGDRSPTQTLDDVNVVATFVGGGSRYEVTIDRAMPRHPFDRYATWSGVVFNHPMHGKTGIGNDGLPAVTPDLALWGWASVKRDGRLITKMAPAHVMVMTRPPMAGVMLEVDTEDKNLLGTRDGYLTVLWPQIQSLVLPLDTTQRRRCVGWGALLGVVAVAWWLAEREIKRPWPVVALSITGTTLLGLGAIVGTEVLSQRLAPAPTPAQQPESAGSPEARVEEAWEIERAAYRTRLLRELDDFDRQARMLELMLGQGDSDHWNEIHEDMADLHLKRDGIEQRLKELDVANGETWAGLKRDLDSMLQHVQD